MGLLEKDIYHKVCNTYQKMCMNYFLSCQHGMISEWLWRFNFYFFICSFYRQRMFVAHHYLVLGSCGSIGFF
jgi:hypothetical protein